MLTNPDLPNEALADADSIACGSDIGNRRSVARSRHARLDWWRVAALALAATGHIVGFGLLALPDTDANVFEPIPVPLADAPDSDRMTLFAALGAAPAPPLPPLPPPIRLAVAAAVSPPSAAPIPPPPEPVEVVTTEFTPVAIAAPLVAAPQNSSAAPAASTPQTATSAPRRLPGNPGQVRNDRDAYMRALMAALLQHRSYPPEARKQRARGTVHVRFSVDRDGHVLASSIARGAGFEILESAALDVLRSADPLPPIPDSLGVDRLTVIVPIEYSLITR